MRFQIVTDGAFIITIISRLKGIKGALMQI